MRQAVINVLEQKPKILDRKKITGQIIDKLPGLIATFDDGLGGMCQDRGIAIQQSPQSLEDFQLGNRLG